MPHLYTPPRRQEAQNTVPVSTLLEVINTLRSFGNRCFKQSRYENAKDRYKQVGFFFNYYSLKFHQVW